MPKPYIFQELADKGRAEGFTANASRKAAKWFQDQARGVQTVDLDALHNAKSRQQSQIRTDDIGSMFHFWYDAKHKDTLPFWDMHPLVMPIEVYNDGFLGLNFHYVSPYQRARLFSALYRNALYDEKGRPTYIGVSYQILTNLSRASAFRPCVKRYLRTHYKSRFFRILPSEWDMALMLPTARWVGATSAKVHRDSARKM